MTALPSAFLSDLLERAKSGLEPLAASVMDAESRLRRDRETLARSWREARPYPHLAIDGLFDPAVLERVAAEFPRPDSRSGWVSWRTAHEDKSTSRGLLGVPRFSQLLLLLLNSEGFVEALREITGMDDLVPDPTFFGAGLQASERGGWLGIHADYLRHPRLGLHRRVNLLVYLNAGWDPDWGGDFELWDRSTLTRQAAYAPLFNRTILFPTRDDTLHGSPVRLTCPKELSRRLISVYYWSALPPHASASSSLLMRLRSRAERAARRLAIQRHWKGPRFYPLE